MNQPATATMLTVQECAENLRASLPSLRDIADDVEVIRQDLACPDCNRCHTPMAEILASIADAPDYETWRDDLDGVIWFDSGKACPGRADTP